MKAKLQAQITEVEKGVTFDRHGSTSISNMTRLKLVTTKGRVDTNLSSAQLIRLGGDLFLLPAIANQMKIGSTITIIISDEEPNEE
jgi:hypothetical protein